MLGALIGAGSTLVGGLMNRRAQKDQAKLQKDFAQNAIQWKAADAEKAGISKLYALGANTTSYSPVGVGGGLGDSISNMGQDIGRAIDASGSEPQRAGRMATALQQAQLDGINIDNEIKRTELRSRLATSTQPGHPPAVNDTDSTPHIPGQGNSTIRVEKKVAPASGSDPNRSYGVAPDVDMYRTKFGYAPEVPAELGEAQESQPLAAISWWLRNKLMPAFVDGYKTVPYPAPPGTTWKFNPVFGEYTLIDKLSRGYVGDRYKK